jgi:hypothetical protein
VALELGLMVLMSKIDERLIQSVKAIASVHRRVPTRKGRPVIHGPPPFTQGHLMRFGPGVDEHPYELLELL